MTPPDEKPVLSRRQLREQQRQASNGAPQNAPAKSNPTAPAEPVSAPDQRAEAPAPEKTSGARRASTDTVTAGTSPDTHTGMTRRQARLERTAGLEIVKPGAATTPAAQPAAKPAAVEPEPVTPAAEKKSETPGGAAPKKPVAEPKKPAGASGPSVETKKTAEKLTVPSSLVIPLEDGIHERDKSVIAAARVDDESDEHHPAVSSAFGKKVEAQLHEGEESTDLHAAPFDQIIARGIETATTSSNSLILPAHPTTGPLTGPITLSGDVIITGSIDLPPELGSTGQHPQAFDKSDIDAMFEDGEENAPSTAGTPVSASKAVSTHTSTRDVISPPAPARSNRVLMILAITAGVLAVAVLSVVIVGFVAGAFGAP